MSTTTTNNQENLEYPKTPTLDKMLKSKEESQSIGEFLDWLQAEKKILLYTQQPEKIEYFDKEFEKEVGKVGEDTSEGIALRWNHTDKWATTGGLTPYSFHIEKLLAEYFTIDLSKAEDERRAVLEYVQKSNLKQ